MTLHEKINCEESSMPPGNPDTEKILGLMWDLNTGEFQFDFKSLISYVWSLSLSKHQCTDYPPSYSIH